MSEYELHLLKNSIISNIDKWILSNPYSEKVYDASARRKTNYYITENFVKNGIQYTKTDLIPDFQLTNTLIYAAMERDYIKFKERNPHTSITQVPKSLFNPSFKKLREELNLGRGFFSSLSPKSGPKFYSKKTLQSLLQTITKWHIDEFGQRDSGLSYSGRPQEKLTYNKEDPNIQNLLYYYSSALYSINKYAILRGIDLSSPTKSHIALSEMVYLKKELVMNEYQITQWESDKTKSYQIIYHLSKYLGFDPITFTPLDDDIFKSGVGDYRRHHFLALMFRKMSSHVDDVLLTSNELHIKEYETSLRNKGLDMEVYVKQIMKSLAQLIEMRDVNGNFIKIKEEHMRKVLYENFGKITGEKVLNKWTENINDFARNLDKFNDRRLSAFNGDYKQFLIDDYENAYKNHFSEIGKITFTKILSTQSNLNFLNAIYSMKLTLKPITMNLDSF